jgi:hypothetical protein
MNMDVDDSDLFGSFTDGQFDLLGFSMEANVSTLVDRSDPQIESILPVAGPVIRISFDATLDCSFWFDLVSVFYDASGQNTAHLDTAFWNLMYYLTVHMIGHRKLTKLGIPPDQLSLTEQPSYQAIIKELQKPGRHEHIQHIMSVPYLTRRVLSYFVVSYCSQVPVEFYLDNRAYPPRMIGELGKHCQADIQAKIQAGEAIKWINLHDEYVSIRRTGTRTHNPYCRSTIVDSPDFGHIVLCEYNFYIWFIGVGGPDAFERVKVDVLLRKLADDRRQRCKRALANDPLGARDRLAQSEYAEALQRKKRLTCVMPTPTLFVDQKNPFTSLKAAFAAATNK